MLQEFTAEIERTARAVANEIHTAMPGEIVSYNASAGTAAVKPVGKFVTSDNVALAYPTLTECPVCFPFCQSAGVGIAFPIKKGDSCIVIVSEVELDSWRSGARSEGSLRFDLTSAMVIPGLLKGKSPAHEKAVMENAVILTAGRAEIAISGEGCRIEAGNSVINVADGGVTIKGNVTVDGIVRADNI